MLYIKYTSQKLIIKALKSKKIDGVYLYHHKMEKSLKYLFKFFPLVNAAGGVVFNQKGEVLFIKRKNKWEFPKGKLGKNEEILDGALREVAEETGVKDLMVKKRLIETYHVFSKSGTYRLKKTYWFSMKTNYDGPLMPQVEENITDVVWKRLDEAPKLMENTYENVKILFDKIKRSG